MQNNYTTARITITTINCAHN